VARLAEMENRIKQIEYPEKIGSGPLPHASHFDRDRRGKGDKAGPPSRSARLFLRDFSRGRAAATRHRGLAWDDPAFGIAWPASTAEALLSDKDRRQPVLAELPPHYRYA